MVDEQLSAAAWTRVNSLLGAWSLGAVQSISPAIGGASNDVYRVATQSGAYFLRIYRRADRATASREHALIAHVRAHGIPAPAVLPTRAGETVVEREGQRCALYTEARGRQLPLGTLNAARARASGELLGELHLATRHLPDTGYVRWTLAWDGPDWVRRLEVVEHAIEAMSTPTDSDRWALTRARAQRRWLADPACPHAHEPAVAAQVTHGDYQDANLFFEAHRVSGVIDWEQAAFMPRAYELIRAAWFMFHGQRALTLQFLDAYVATTKMSPAELRDGAAGWAAFHDHHVWPLEQVFLHHNEAARRYIPHLPFEPFSKLWDGII